MASLVSAPADGRPGTIVPNADVRQQIASSALSRYQKVAIAVVVIIAAIDGYDVLSVTFAAPGISAEWNLAPTALGVVISLGLIGMAIGSFLFATLADRFGRRPVALTCLIAITIGMLGCGLASSLWQLGIWRLLTGLAIGTLVAVSNPLASEYSNARNREFVVSLVTIGFPAGAVVGGFVAAVLLSYFEWRSVFLLGAAMTFCVIPIAAYALPESLAWLLHRPGPESLAKINVFLRRCGRTPLMVIPMLPEEQRATTSSTAAQSNYLANAALIATGYFFYVMTCYFFLGWLPKLIALRGFSPSLAVTVSVVANIGGVAGGLATGLFARRIGLKLLTLIAMTAFSVSIVLFAVLPLGIAETCAVAALVGFMLFAASAGFYGLVTCIFPVNVRVTGIGIVLGVGRVGSALGPLVAGILLSAVSDPRAVTLLMALGPLVAVGTFWKIRLPDAANP